MANADTLKGADAYSGNALDAAKVQRNTEIAKIKLKKIKNSGGILIKDGNAAGSMVPQGK